MFTMLFILGVGLMVVGNIRMAKRPGLGVAMWVTGIVVAGLAAAVGSLG